MTFMALLIVRGRKPFVPFMALRCRSRRTHPSRWIGISIAPAQWSYSPQLEGEESASLEAHRCVKRGDVAGVRGKIEKQLSCQAHQPVPHLALLTPRTISLHSS